ncbi:MAG: Uma2 family endonuclease [Isosphaeraceae bacterium]
MSTVAPRPTYPYRGDPDYPTSDGEPMAETGIHVDLMLELLGTLMMRLVDDPMAYAGANMFLYYAEGDKRRVVSPDVFVTLGVPKEPQRVNYIVWQEGKPPDVIIELTSKSTRANDEGPKRLLYQDVLKIPEYFLFDPTEDYLKPSLQGYRLVNGAYQPIGLVDGRMRCEILGLDLVREGKMLRLYDAATGLKLLNSKETYRWAREVHLQATRERNRADQQERRAEQERARAEAEARKAEQERARADESAAEVRRLMKEIEELKRQAGGS